MYFNGPILKPKEDDKIDIDAMEASITYHFKKEYTLRDKYYPFVKSYLPKTEHLLFRHIAKYEDINSEIVNSPYLTNYPKFLQSDRDIIFKVTQINEDEMKEDIKKVPLPGNLTEKANFQPLWVTLLLIIRFYMEKKDKAKLNAIFCYYGYSIYWQRWQKQFYRKGFLPKKETMEYTINNLSAKFAIRQQGSIKGMLRYEVAQATTETYFDEMMDLCDEDIRYIIDQIATRVARKVVHIANEYYKNYEKNEVIFKGTSALDDQGSQRLDTSVSAEVEVLAQKYTTLFYTYGPNMQILKQAAIMAKDASLKELQVVLEKIATDVPSSEMKEFYSAIFYVYLASGDPRATTASVHSLRFVAIMRDVFKKGNSVNPNIVKISELLNKWLENSSNIYRVTKRDPTKTGYRRAVFYYFVLFVTSNK